ncbi:MAG: hypothetical protein IPM60_15360 [Rhodospirillales bacterium]|nr:hypothetical protein [Rhodospirillales bacterium]
MAQQGLRDYLAALTVGQEEERRRLARELHDDTVQSLIALNQRIQLAQTGGKGRGRTTGRDGGAGDGSHRRLATDDPRPAAELPRRPGAVSRAGTAGPRSVGRVGRPIEFTAIGDERRLDPRWNWPSIASPRRRCATSAATRARAGPE